MARPRAIEARRAAQCPRHGCTPQRRRGTSANDASRRARSVVVCQRRGRGPRYVMLMAARQSQRRRRNRLSAISHVRQPIPARAPAPPPAPAQPRTSTTDAVGSIPSDFAMAPLEQQWVKVQQKTFTKWYASLDALRPPAAHAVAQAQQQAPPARCRGQRPHPRSLRRGQCRRASPPAQSCC